MEQIKISLTPYQDKYTKKIIQNRFNIFANGERIGDLERRLNRNSGKMTWDINYDRDKMNCANDNTSTIIAAKRAIIEDYSKYKVTASAPAQKVKVKELPFGDNSDFFPTPSALVGRMLNRVNWKGLKTILEPSAGKGDIVECILAYGDSSVKYDGRYYLRGIHPDIDCIEIDANLRYILMGKKFRVVHDDFLTYKTQKRYDLIIMNPPFSNGDEHLLKALEMQEQSGGQIVCLLNAETIRNTYTNRRKVLMQKLDKYGAQIEYIKDGFKRAERKTDTTIALIYIDIPRSDSHSEIFERMEKAARQRMEEHSESYEVAPNDKVEALIRSYEIETAATIEFFKEYNGLIGKIARSDEHKNDSDKETVGFTLTVGGHSYLGNDGIGTEETNEYLKIIRRKYWYKLLSLPQITSKLTSQMKKDFFNRLDEMSNYEFSRFNAEWLALSINAALWEGIDDEIIKLFKKFTEEHAYYPECTNNIHYYNGWKTNKAHKVNYKVIIPSYGAFARYSFNGVLDVYECYDLLSDLEKTLNYLDGNRTDPCSLLNALDVANSRGQTKDICCKYFSVTFYKKGTCHIVFHKEAYRLIDALNIYAARNYKWLPPSYGQKHYHEMDDEEKKVIDEFQGEQAYETVMQDKAGYLIGDTRPTMLMLN